MPASMSTRVGGVGRRMHNGLHPDVAPNVVNDSKLTFRFRYSAPYIDHLWPHPNGEVVLVVVVAVLGVRLRAAAAALHSSIVNTNSAIFAHTVSGFGFV